MKPPAKLITVLAIAALVLGLAACGGGGGGRSTSSTSSTSSPTASAESSPQGGSVSFGKPHPRANAQTRAERRQAGNAAAFVEPGADNSVPTFGSEASAAERSEAEANLNAYLAARAARDWAKACSLLAGSVRQGFEKLAASSSKPGAKPSCARIMPVMAPLRPGVPANPLKGALLAFRVHGASAFALFYGPPGHQQYMVPMNREAGGWRSTQAAPIAYPPGSEASPTR